MRWDKNFFARVRGNIIKWWQQVVLPVLHINNNDRWKGRSFNKQQREDNIAEESEDMLSSMQGNAETMDSDSSVSADREESDALEVLNRIQREKEQERQREIERARQQAADKDRVASIMNANKVDVNAFIEAGKAAIQDGKKEEADADMLKAQEIMDRLNREAAEDEAKKQAEIEAAKQQAKETFG